MSYLLPLARTFSQAKHLWFCSWQSMWAASPGGLSVDEISGCTLDVLITMWMTHHIAANQGSLLCESLWYESWNVQRIKQMACLRRCWSGSALWKVYPWLLELFPGKVFNEEKVNRAQPFLRTSGSASRKRPQSRRGQPTSPGQQQPALRSVHVAQN